MSDDPAEIPVHCPRCGNDGPHDMRGTFTREFSRVKGGAREAVAREWRRFGCPQCGNLFAIVEREVSD